MYSIEEQTKDPAFNLAIEEYLYRTVAPGHPGYFFLWQNEPSIIVGRFQNTAQEVNRTFAAERGIHVVRRISGGGAVYHDLGNLNYSFILPNDGGAPFDFARYAQPIVETLKKLGVRAEFSSRNDLVIDGRKFSGSAQHMDSQRLLHHGTLLFDSDLSVLAQALNVDSEKFTSKGFASVRSRVTNIRPHLPVPLSPEEFRDALRSSLSDLGAKALSEEDLAAIEELRREKYGTWDWNWGASPEFTERKAQRFPWGKVEALLNVKEGVIHSIRFYGDFFGTEDRSELEEAFIKRRYRAEDLKEALGTIALDRYFRGAAPEEFLAFLLS